MLGPAARLPWCVRTYPFEVASLSAALLLGALVLFDQFAPPAADLFPRWALRQPAGAFTAAVSMLSGVALLIGLAWLRDLRVIASSLLLLALVWASLGVLFFPALSPIGFSFLVVFSVLCVLRGVFLLAASGQIEQARDEG